jgi:hypothetical protein
MLRATQNPQGASAGDLNLNIVGSPVAVTYNINADEQIVYLTTTGDSSFAEWRDAMLAVLSDPSYRRGMGFLSDRRDQTDVPDGEFASAAADFLKAHSEAMGDCFWAAVASRPAVFGVMRMFSVTKTVKGVTYMPFADFEEARGWLLDSRACPAPR